ncbi:hemoglobin [Caulobacter ginsengisoli]|uniref:Hemoglobin n=1 Tax=Caulobacter ginsengisoli TaxID=400775 RepID=A0ABU0IPF0_9CAUL|nr:group 1 truncated hemoglobin [Caulobacter ginsengisoli]MDQ0463865.1 hemoglobin [Caulobacter ginsengisoli]
MKHLVIALALAPTLVLAQEQPVDPYTQSNANAGASPVTGATLLEAFHGKAGLDRVVDDFVDRITTDPRIADVFKSHDIVRLRRTLKEQFCYLLNGGCDYTGREMTSVHKDLGVTTAEFNFLVEDLQAAMDREQVPFAAQNRLLALLAPMKRPIVTR